MPSRFEMITALHEETLQAVTANTKSWTEFLSSACLNYKLPFDEQLLVFAQRPDATAVLELNKWNSLYNRWVNRGAKSIAVLDDENPSRLKHYFDVSDTHAGKNSRPVPIWSMTAECQTEVIEVLAATFGELEATDSLGSAILDATGNAVTDNVTDYLDDLALVTNSEAVTPNEFTDLLRSSVAFMVLRRSSEDPWDYLREHDFVSLSELDTPEAATILGIAVADLAQMALREISLTVLALQRETEASRTVALATLSVDTEPARLERNNNESDIQRNSRRLLAAELGSPDGGQPRDWNLGATPQAVPDGTSQGTLFGDEDQWDAILAPSRSQRTSRSDVGETDRKSSQSTRSRRRAEAQQPDALGGTDEQHQSTGNRDSARQLSLLLDAEALLDAATGDTPTERATEDKTVALSTLEQEQHRPIESIKLKQEPHNFQITDDNLGHGGAKQRYKWNIEAIKTLKAIEAENRPATPDEQEILSRYVGWGAIQQAFDERNNSWGNEYSELKSLLTDEEYSFARASTLNAHYTPPSIIRAIYQAIVNMGFTTGNVLEPACGIGNFFGLLPDSMKDSHLYGVEIDPLTATIARQLYHSADIRTEGFEQSSFPVNFFDLAIGNVPFGNYQLVDKRYEKHSFLIHDYFFAKTLDKVRPGGIVAFITSKGTLDKQNPSTRRYLAERAELIGAIRLPNNAFQDSAGTAVTADIVFLQKREHPVITEPDWIYLDQTADGIPVNSYFTQNPEMILGTMTTEGRQYGREDNTTCKPFDDRNLTELLTQAVSRLNAEYKTIERDEDEIEADNSLPADPSVRNYSFTSFGDKLYYRDDSRMYPHQTSATATSRIKGLIEVREATRELIELQTDDASDTEVTYAQTKLNTIYENFTHKYGLITSRANSSAFGKDSSYPLLASLENIDADGNLVTKAQMFTSRTIRPYVRPTSADTPSVALAISLAEKAVVDLPYMAMLCNLPEDKITSELEGIIFKVPKVNPDTTKWQTADEYLSGNVREKLKEARLACASDPSYEVNVKALELALPKDLSASEISVRLGATWIPASDIKDFIFELLETPSFQRYNINVRYTSLTAQWSIEGKNRDGNNVLANLTYGTRKANAYRLIEDTLNLRDTRIFDYQTDTDGKRIAVLNKQESAIAQAKQEIIKARFKDWIFTDPHRRERLTRLYNDTFNSMRLRTFDGSHLVFPGMNPEITLNAHQVNAVARIIYGGNSLLAHVVGAGKTYTMVAASQELKRLGLCSKSLIVVPNHITEQWASEYLQLYPSANILVATKRDFEKKNRKRFTARIATGEYDAVIIGHSQFEKIPMSITYQQEMLTQEIEEIVSGIATIKQERGDTYTIKQMESTKKKLEARLKKLNDQSKKDDTLTFEELGIDRLFVDESHFYKNLFTFTKMRNVGGIAQSEAQKSSDLFMKCRYLDTKTGSKGIIFATGTPISNSMVELYSIQRYLQYGELERLALTHFDCWASTFGETVSTIELSPEGTGFRQKTRFAKFYNLPELMALFRQVADIQTTDMLSLPVPEVDYHNISIAPSAFQRELLRELSERADRVRNGMVSAEKDNMLVITNDGRKLALDQRLLDPMLPDSPASKVSVCVENVFQVWEHHTNTKQAQLIFCDLSTPKTDGSFSIYDDIRTKLITLGVPKDEIVFIHEANTEAKKAELFAKVRSGSVRVLIGSTAKMGAGTNVQNKLIAIHDLDCPWRPSDLEQRKGRLVRQGNTNTKVEIFRYVTENTFDSYLWQIIESKQHFIGQIMTAKSPVRSAEDIDEQALSYAEIKALATGNPQIKERMDLDVEVTKLKMLKADHLSERYRLEDSILVYYPQQIKALEEKVAGLAADIATAAANKPADKEHFSMMVDTHTYTDRKAAGEAMLAITASMTTPEPVSLGQYAGFQTELTYDSIHREYQCILIGNLRHTVTLGADALGNITRITNALDAFQTQYVSYQDQLINVCQQLENAKFEVTKPFDREAELVDKIARLAELDAKLNMDKPDQELIDESDGERDEDTELSKSRDEDNAR